jgi:CoA-disulfide reductase
MKNKILIIGGVAGGATTAARLRRMDESAEIIMFERGEYISFANCGLPYYIGNVITSRDALLVQTVEGMSKKFNLDIRNFSEVTEINPTNKTVSVKNLATNETYEESYDKLVISTGAYPTRPNIKGINEAKNLFTLRNIPDMDGIKSFIKENNPRKAVVIGAGFIGIEMAENLHELGLNVSLVEMANQVLAPLDFEMAQYLHRHIIDQNVKLFLNNGIKAFSEEGKVVVLNNDKQLEADLIIFAIGVKPDNQLAKAANINLGKKGGILVNEYLETNQPDIYAVGDVIEVKDTITGNLTLIPLAGPANRQARIVANNIAGHKEKYLGTQGTSVAKVFDFTAGTTGVNEKFLKSIKAEYDVIHIHPGSHAGYYPGSATISMKVLYNPKTEEIYGAQAVGMDGVDKRIDVLATAIKAGMKITDLRNIELAYAPPFSSAKDPINMIGYVAENKKNGIVNTINFDKINDLVKQGEYLLDVREVIENEIGTIQGSVNIPLGELRDRLSELPKNKTIYVFCQVGIRGYIGTRILMQNGFDAINLDGGYKSYSCVYDTELTQHCCDTDDEGNMLLEETLAENSQMNEIKEVTLKVDACGLQCPGPIVQLYKSLETLNNGEVLEIKATDPGFKVDVRKWAEKTGNTLLSLNSEGKTFVATVQKGSKALNVSTENKVIEDKNGTTIVVFSQDLDKAIAAFIIAQGAATMGKKVSLFFTFWGLNVLRQAKKVRVRKDFMEKMFGWMMPRGPKKLPISNMNMGGMGSKMIKSIMKKKNVDALEVMMSTAIELGVNLQACAMSMDIMGIKKEELIDGIEVVGVATYLADTTTANHNLFI